MKAILFECISHLANEFEVQLLCQIANVSRSGYYKWLTRRGRLNRWQLAEHDLMQLVSAVHSIRPSRGYRHIAERLRQEGVWNSRVLVCMQTLGIQAKLRRKKRIGVGSEHRTVPNLLKRKFRASKPMQKIVSDVTYLYSRGTVQYLSVFLDLYNKLATKMTYNSSCGHLKESF